MNFSKRLSSAKIVEFRPSHKITIQQIIGQTRKDKDVWVRFVDMEKHPTSQSVERKYGTAEGIKKSMKC